MTHRGFSLVETLVYLGLFSLLITGSGMGAFAIGASSERMNELSHIEFEGVFLLKKARQAVMHGKVPDAENMQSLTPYIVQDFSVLYEELENPAYIDIRFSLVHGEFGKRDFSDRIYLLAP